MPSKKIRNNTRETFFGFKVSGKRDLFHTSEVPQIFSSNITWTVTGTGLTAGDLTMVTTQLTSGTSTTGSTTSTPATLTLTPNATVVCSSFSWAVGNGTPTWSGNYIGATITIDGFSRRQQSGESSGIFSSINEFTGRVIGPSKPITISWDFSPSGFPSGTFAMYFAPGFIQVNGVKLFNNANVQYTV